MYLLLIIVQIVWHGYVLSTLWEWFFVPIFGLPQLTMLQALGVMVTARAILPFFCKEKANQWEDLIGNFLYSTFLLGIGWIITWFT